MTVKFTNNASSSLSSGINSTATSLTVADASSFPSLSGADDYCYLTIQQATATTREVVKATARSSNTFTIVRAQDNTSAASFSSGDTVELRLTSALLQDVIDQATVEGIKTNFQYVPTAGQTQFSGADNSGDTMIINDSELVNVYMNGVRLVQGSDYTVSSANNRITLTSGATTADIIDIEVFGNFTGQSGAAVAITGGAIAGTAITTGSINNTPIGATQANTVAATTLTANSVAVDNITIDGTEIDLSSGSLLIDVAADIKLDADSSNIYLADGGTDIVLLSTNSSDLNIRNLIADKDIYFQGNDSDNGGNFTALTLDMSAAGEATFNAGIKLGDGYAAQFGASQDLLVYHSSNENIIQANTSDQDLLFKGKDGSSTITALTLDMSNAGAATFNSFIYLDYIRGKNDINTGVNIAGSDVLELQTGGSARLHIDSSGNVGIGITNPTTALEVIGDIKIKQGSGYSNYGLIDVSEAVLTLETYSVNTSSYPANIIFKPAGTERIRIDSSGTLRINNTRNTATKLHVVGGTASGTMYDTAIFAGGQNSTSGSGARIYLSGCENDPIARGTIIAGQMTDNANSHALIFSTSGNSQAPAERMRIDSSGKVGIGISSGLDRDLHIKGSGSDVGIQIEKDSAGEFRIAYDGTGPYLYNENTAHPFRIYTGGAETFRFHADGFLTMPAQPAFQAYKSAQNDIAINTAVVIAFQNERFDMSSNFANNTFTAPVTGKYQINATIRLLSIDTAANYIQVNLVTSNRTYEMFLLDPGRFSGDVDYFTFSASHLVDMDASDSLYLYVYQSGGSAQLDIGGGGDSHFSGYLVS